MANHRNRKEQYKFWVLAWVGLAQYVVVILSLAYVVPDWHAQVLFSEWMDS